MTAPSLPRLDPATAPADPHELFAEWFADARAAGVHEPDAMALATTTASGRPSVRMVLLRGHGPGGFCFFTGYGSRKGRELAESPFAALCFYWQQAHRQVRIEGAVARVTDAESDAYFSRRPIGSRLSAVASPQSEVVPSREWLEERVADLTRTHRHGEIPRPAGWGGFRLTPDAMEFWQQAEHRLHDRIGYRRTGDGWTRERLAP
jgi:pyridoxamine 5'-phosphate oxidase